MFTTHSISTARLILLLACFGIPCVTFATEVLPVQIVTGDYGREYAVDWTLWTRGDQIISLSPGSHTFSNLTSSFTFTVNADGSIVSGAPESATAAGNTLSLQTLNIAIDPGQYSRLYEGYGGEQVTGPQTLSSIIGLEDSLLGPAETAIANFIADANGNLALTAGRGSVEVANAQISFRNVTYTIDAGAYSRPYIPFGGPWITGLNSVVGIPGVVDGISSALTSQIARFTVDADGTIHLLSDSSSVQILAGLIRFNAVSIAVDPQEWPRFYMPVGDGERMGASSFFAIPGVLDRVVTLSNQKIVEFTADSLGNLAVTDGADHAQISRAKIQFNNVAITVTTAHFSDAYDFLSGTRQVGVQPEVMIPLVSEVFELPNQPGQTSTVAVDQNGFSIDGTSMSPAWIAPAPGSTIKFEIARAARAASAASATSAASAATAEHSASGGGCVPSANAGERGRPMSTNLADVFTSPLGIGLLFALVRRLRRTRAS